MEGNFAVFEYMYRDAGNFKTVGRQILSGWNPEAEAVIRGCLEWSDQFVAEQIGILALCEEHWDSMGEGPSDLDHAFHEFLSLTPAGNEGADLQIWGSLDEMLVRMHLAAGKWDVTLSPNCDL